jgi:eukaryotic translation initiation factor 2C
LSGRDKAYDPLPLISALNVILAKFPSKTGGVLVGKNRFFFPQDMQNIGGGLEAWKGFYSSVRPVYKQLSINLNVATTAMYKPGNMAELMLEVRTVLGNRVGGFFKSVRVQTSHLGYKAKKSVKRIHNKSARLEQFQADEYGKVVTVEEYFKRSRSLSLL